MARQQEEEWGGGGVVEEGSADMPVYLGISCVKEGRGERRGGGGGRVEKEVESSTTLAGVTLEELEQTLLGRKQGRGGGGGEGGGGANVNPGSFFIDFKGSVCRM